MYAFPENTIGPVEEFDVFYTDINGDQVKDLIVGDRLKVAILLWDGSQYREAFKHSYEYWKYHPYSRVFLEDWTMDGTPEVIFDYRGDNGGTGVLYEFWVRHIIHCQQSNCSMVWMERTAAITHEEAFGGLNLYQAAPERSTTPNGLPEIRAESQLFAVYSPDFYLPSETNSAADSLSTLTVYTTTLNSYIWNGIEFEVKGSEAISLPYTIRELASHSTTGPDGTEAKIDIIDNYSLDRRNDICQLVVNGNEIGGPFGCKDNFTTVEWQDITSDGIAEITITALSGSKPVDREFNLLSDVDCVHQRFLAYQWDGSIATPIADIAGCVVDEQLFGVRIEDYTGDAALEIITPDNLYVGDECLKEPWGSRYDCWYELAADPGLRIYRFNGQVYDLWKEIPAQ